MRVKTVFSRVAMAVAGGVVLAAAPLGAQTVDFNSLGYDNGTCNWSGSSSEIKAHQGFEFYGLRALDVDNYQDCWDPGQANGYDVVPSKTVALGTGQAFIQQAGATPFQLGSLTMGAGWTATSLTFRGYTEMFVEPEPSVAPQDPAYVLFASLTPGSLQHISFDGWTGLKFFTIGVQFGEDTQYGSANFNRAALGLSANEPALPYQTYFIANMRVVPEPASIALLAAGLAGLGIIARRRRSTR